MGTVSHITNHPHFEGNPIPKAMQDANVGVPAKPHTMPPLGEQMGMIREHFSKFLCPTCFGDGLVFRDSAGKLRGVPYERARAHDEICPTCMGLGRVNVKNGGEAA